MDEDYYLLEVSYCDGEDTPSTFRSTESVLGSVQDFPFVDDDQSIEAPQDELDATNQESISDSRCANPPGILQALANDDAKGVSDHISTIGTGGMKFGSKGLTVLLIASVNCGVEVNKALLDGGADPNERDAFGRLPLLTAAACGKHDVLKLLLKCGADQNAVLEGPGDNTEFAEDQEVQLGEEIKAKNLKIPTLHGEGRSALHFAAKSNSSACVKLLLDAKVDPNSKDLWGITPVMLAGEDINLGDSSAIKNYEKIVFYLIDRGADVNCNLENLYEKRQNTDCEPPIHRAAKLQSSNALRWLLEKGADPNWSCKDLEWNTALQVAAEKAANSENPAPDCISVLLSYGADLCSENENEVTALETILGQTLRPIKFFNSVLDDQVTLIGDTNDKNCEVSVNFKAMCPEGDDGQQKVLHELMEGEDISKWMRYEIFRHPLTRAFVTAKWDGLKGLFYVYLSAYVIHVIFLSLFATFAHCDLFRMFNQEYSKAMLRTGIPVSRNLVIVTAIMVLVNVVAMCCVFPRRYPFRLEMMRSVVSSILSIVVSIFTEYDGNVLGKGIDEKQNEVFWVKERLTETERSTPMSKVEDFIETSPLIDQSIILHCTSIAIFLSWLELMLLVGRFSWAADALLYTAVLKNVLRVFATYGFMVVGFAFVFFLEFRNADNRAFGDPWRSLVKTMVMMMGEFEYMNIFSGDSGDEKVWEKSSLPWFSRLIFLGFVVLASIALMNLMLGLAVSDTQDLVNESSERQQMKVAECVIHWEYVVYVLESFCCYSHRLKECLKRRRTIPTNYKFHLSLRKSPFQDRNITKNLAMIALKNREKRKKRRSPEKHNLQSILTKSSATTPPENFAARRQVLSISEDLPGILDFVRKEMADLRREFAEIKEMMEFRFNMNKQTPWHQSQCQPKTGRKKLNPDDKRRTVRNTRNLLNNSPI